MTTAARPTFDPARGGQARGEKDLSALSKQYSSRDLPSHTRLKYREHGQGTIDEITGRDFRKELEERERKEDKTVKKTQDVPHKRTKIDQTNLDADDPLDDDDENSDSNDSDDDDFSNAHLLAELAKIKKERAVELEKKEKEKRQEEEKIRMENILSGNPLLNYAAQVPKSDLKIKRRWDDDVVFKNCARYEPDRKKEFINDSLRSEFHKKFMDKYIK